MRYLPLLTALLLVAGCGDEDVTAPWREEPLVRVVTPGNHAVVSAVVEIVAEAHDDAGIAKVEFYIDSALVRTDTESPYSYSWNTFSYGDSTAHTIYAKVYDTDDHVCGSRSVTVTVDNRLIFNRTFRVSLIQSFARAHVRRNIEEYALCLHPDYVFEFCDEDLADPGWNWSNWIEKATDVEVTGNMFDTEAVTHISAGFINLTDTGAVDPEDSFKTLRVGAVPDTFTVCWGDFAVDMSVVEEQHDQSINRWVDGRAKFYLRPDPLYEGQWTIWKIKELGNKGGKATERTSWSRLKTMYRK